MHHPSNSVRSDRQNPNGHGRHLFATVLGNAIEYYDNALYGLLAAFLGRAFFGFRDSSTALLATYATFILSYAVRPVAGVLLGRLADLRGYRFVLILTVNLMTLGTFGIGMLPTYQAVGIWSPLLLILCRAMQGIGASAEFTVATSYALEHGPARRQQYLSGWSIAATNVGPLIASIIAIAVTWTYGARFFASGAWRIPFLLAGPVGLLTLYLRTKISDDGLLNGTSVADRKSSRVPLFLALRGQWSMVARVIALGAGQRVGGFCIQTYFVTALIRQGFDGPLAMVGSVLLYLVGAPAAIFGGLLADRIGGRKVLVVGFAIFAAVTVPIFTVLGTSVPLTLLALVICSTINNMIAPPLSHAYIMAFPSAVRGAAAALNYNLGTVLFGATAPLIATWLVSFTGSEVAFGWYMAAICMLSCLTAAFAYPRQLARVASE
jgi:MHS family proline/betaine transporter-like MFS transporter